MTGREPWSAVDARAAIRAERRPYVLKTWVLAAILVVLCIASLAIPATSMTLYGFGDVFDALALWAESVFGGLTANAHYSAAELVEQCPTYFEVMKRIAITAIAVGCGAMTAVSGSLYQMVFRNPIAAPTMLGVGNGVTLGVVALVLVFGVSAPYFTGFRYVFCYVGALVVLALVVGSSFVLGKGRIVVVDMLLVGTVFSALAGQAITYVTYCVFDEDAWDVFTLINEMLDVNTEPVSLIVLAVSLVVTMVPIALLRFQLNMVAFDEADMRLTGINPLAMRFVALACATVMIVSSQVQIGTIAMVALIAPYAARIAFGAEFTKQFWGAALIGALLVVLCEDLSSLAGIALFHSGLWLSVPIGLAANIVCLPFFAWIMASQSRVWE